MVLGLADIFTKEKRSWVMSLIRSKDTKAELALAKALRRHKVRYRRHMNLLGTPDFLVSSGSKKLLVFVDGDFWHGWNYRKKKPRLSPYWRKKIERNMARDKKQAALLRKAGWKVVRIWEHDINKDVLASVTLITKALKVHH
jgi:DNA mismatch endonuclease (patch repair protein)